MKKKWVAPRVEVQKFEANEYVAACWGVACDTQAAEEWEMSYFHIPKNHDSGVCGSFDNQVVYDDNNDNVADRMVELHGYERQATLYTDNTYRTEKDIRDIKPGDKIYWITKDLGFVKYHHVGTVQATVPGHPNRS